MGYYGAPQPMNQFTDPNNTTVFVGGPVGMYSTGASAMANYWAPQPMNQFIDPNNTTVFIGDPPCRRRKENRPLQGHSTVRPWYAPCFCPENTYPAVQSTRSAVSRGEGFVRFTSEEDQQKALSEMQEVCCGNLPKCKSEIEFGRMPGS
ncbi:hypothetical protein BU26DRAFT_566467 [Trematosphaeria pertusa]|uniref:RRM domain-containing protein n=1 Tax=Trematosphaeria pertusa TaxID=390896 RepID=A0A6A6IDB2_9PLEO|nr:uncharacterized protein BU26DRAFT_566467 [Trematosphaeria pertusa]KAF2247493.1 hypothetical protein BU26DRAFT_566467 [Trematosphaeria pertusa]